MQYFEKQGNALIFRQDGETVRVEPWQKDSLRVRGTLLSEIEEGSIALLDPEPVEAEIELVDELKATIKNGKIQAVQKILLHLFAFHKAHCNKISDRFLCYLFDCTPHFFFIICNTKNGEDVRKTGHLGNGDIIFDLDIFCKAFQRFQIRTCQVMIDYNLRISSAYGLNA